MEQNKNSNISINNDKENEDVKEEISQDIKQDQITENINTEKQRDDITKLLNDNKNIVKTTNDVDDVNPSSREEQIPLKLLVTTLSDVNKSFSTNIISGPPLSDFEFSNGKLAEKEHATSTIFKFVNEIPQMFDYVVTKNESQDVNDLIDKGPQKFDNVPTVIKSSEIFNPSTMSVRLKLKEKIIDTPITDPNSLEQRAIKLRTIQPLARENPQTSASRLENSVRSFIDVFLSLYNILLFIPKKATVLEVTQNDEVTTTLSRFPFFDSNGPHIFYSLFARQPEWFIDEMNKLFKENQLAIGEYGVISRGGRKIASIIKAAIDQYTSAVFRENYNQLLNNQLRTDQLIDMLEAFTLEHDQVMLEDYLHDDTLTLMYAFTNTEAILGMVKYFSDPKLVESIMSIWHEAITDTNRLWHRSLDELWVQQTTSEILGARFNSEFLKNINIGSRNSAIDMLIFECFAERLEFRIQYNSNPMGPEAIIEILSIYLFIKLYPRVAQKCITQLGFRLNTLYKLFLPKLWMQFVSQYGTIVNRQRKIVQTDRETQLDSVESRSGLTYSIFNLTKNRNQANKELNRFVTFLQKMNEICFPTINDFHLIRKKKAKFPYLYESFTAYMSWPKTEQGFFSSGEIPSFGRDIVSIIQSMSELIQLNSETSPLKTNIPKQFLQQFNSWMNSLTSIASSAAVPFTTTMRRMQEVIFNSAYYPGDQFDPQNFPYMPKEIGFAANDDAMQTSTIKTKPLYINKLNVNVSLNHIMTLEGEHYRLILNPRDGKPLGNNGNLRSDMSPINAGSMVNMYYAIIDNAKRFGYAMQFGQWLLNPKMANNPLKHVAEELSEKYMRMAQWVPWFRAVFAKFGVEYEEIFEQTVNNNSIALDNRSMDSVLVLLDPEVLRPVKSPKDSFFGKRFNYIDSYDDRKLQILAKPILINNSVINSVKQGWYFGRLQVQELSPTQTDLTHLWDDETVINSVIFFRESYKSGFCIGMNYKSTKTNEEKRFILPYNKSGVKRVLIKLDNFNQIKRIYLPALAKAIALGNIILYIRNLQIKINIVDKTSLTTDYSEPIMDESSILEILKTSCGEILERIFLTTQYATNYIENAAVLTSYVQYFATDSITNDDLFCSVLSNSITRPENSILPTADMLGYGPDPDGYKLLDGSLKIDANIINFNNSIPCLAENLTSAVKVELIAKVLSNDSDYVNV